MSSINTRTQRKLARRARNTAPSMRIVAVPKPRKSWLLAGTALVTGVVVAGFGSIATSTHAEAATCGVQTGVLFGDYPTIVTCASDVGEDVSNFDSSGDFDENLLLQSGVDNVTDPLNPVNVPTLYGGGPDSGNDGVGIDGGDGNHRIKVFLHDQSAIWAEEHGIYVNTDGKASGGADPANIIIDSSAMIAASYDGGAYDGIHALLDNTNSPGSIEVTNRGVIGVDFVEGFGIADDGTWENADGSGKTLTHVSGVNGVFEIRNVDGNGMFAQADPGDGGVGYIKMTNAYGAYIFAGGDGDAVTQQGDGMAAIIVDGDATGFIEMDNWGTIGGNYIEDGVDYGFNINGTTFEDRGMYANNAGSGATTMRNLSMASINTTGTGMAGNNSGGKLEIYNGDASQNEPPLPDNPDGFIDAGWDGIWARNSNGGDIDVYNGLKSDSNSQIYAGGNSNDSGDELYGIYAQGIGDGDGSSIVRVFNYGYVQARDEYSDAVVYAETSENENGYAAVMNGGMGVEYNVMNIDARLDGYRRRLTDIPGELDTNISSTDANGIETKKDGGFFTQTLGDEYTPQGYTISTNAVLGNYGVELVEGLLGATVEELGISQFHAFSTVAKNYGTWDFTRDDNYLTPGFYRDRDADEWVMLEEGAVAEGSIGGVYAPGGSAWLNRNFSNANSGLFNYGTMIGQGSNRDPVLDIQTRSYSYNSDAVRDPDWVKEDGEDQKFSSGFSNFVSIYNAGYIDNHEVWYEYDDAYVFESEEAQLAALDAGGYYMTETTYGVIGSRDTPSNWDMDVQQAFDTNFGFQDASVGGVNWEFIEDTMLGYNEETGRYEGELRRFSRAADDKLLVAEGEEGKGAAVFSLNEGLLIGQVEVDIARNADLFGLGALIEEQQDLFLKAKVEDGPELEWKPEGDYYFRGGEISSLHVNPGAWFTEGQSKFFGRNDVYINTGLIQAAFRAGGEGSSEETWLRDLEHTYNLGVISLLDGAATDELVIGGNEDGDYYEYYGGLPFYNTLMGLGEGDGDEVDYAGMYDTGYFALDSFLSSEDSKGPLRARSDVFVLPGYMGGSTGLIVRNANLDAEGQGVNQRGIDVVEYRSVGTNEYGCSVQGEALCGDGGTLFISDMSPNYANEGGIPVIRDGFYDWTLWHDGDRKEFELRSDFGGNSVRLPGIITGAQNIFYDTVEVVQDHRFGGQIGGAGGGGADLATEYVVPEYSAPAAAGTQSALWVKATGSWANQDSTLSTGAMTYDTSYDQDTYSILGGGDFKPGGSDSPFRIGLFGGYINSSLDFDTGGASVDYEGGAIGAYAAYNNGAFYTDATVKGDFLNTTYSGDTIDDVDADTTNVGVLANIGYRMMMGSGFIEPIASLAYVDTSVDDSTNNGTSVNFSNGESLRAGAGARVGTEFATGGGTTELSLLGKVWNEFEGDNTVTVTDQFMNTETFTDDTSGVFGEVSATAAMTSADGTLSGFLTGGSRFGENFTSWNAQVGVRKGF